MAYILATIADLLSARGLKIDIMLSRPYVVHIGREWSFSCRRAHPGMGYRPAISMAEGFERLACWVEDMVV